MIEYIIRWIWWIGWRSMVSLACVITIQNVVYTESGQRIETKPLLVATVCLILAIRIWSSRLPNHTQGDD